jgi:hypothetical protein
MSRSGRITALACLLLMACSMPMPSDDLLEHLRRIRAVSHIHIGHVDQVDAVVTVLGLSGQRDGHRYKIRRSDLNRIRSDTAHASFWHADVKVLMSPDGKWMVTEQKGDLIVQDVGRASVRTLALSDRVLGQVHWSPDSSFLMFVERAPRWDPRALRELDNIVYITVYRCRDGQRGNLQWYGEGAAGASWEWLEIPPGILELR